VPGVHYTVIETEDDEVVTPYTSAFLSGRAVTNVTLQEQCPDDHPTTWPCPTTAPPCRTWCRRSTAPRPSWSTAASASPCLVADGSLAGPWAWPAAAGRGSFYVDAFLGETGRSAQVASISPAQAPLLGSLWYLFDDGRFWLVAQNRQPFFELRNVALNWQ
jgi:hypothetical protein